LPAGHHAYCPEAHRGRYRTLHRAPSAAIGTSTGASKSLRRNYRTLQCASLLFSLPPQASLT
jgi:hypothetical protein